MLNTTIARSVQAALPAVLLVFALLGCQKKTADVARTIQAPLTIRQGYGPFYPSFAIMSPDLPDRSMWGKIQLPLRGKPKNWSRLTQTMVWLDSYQLVYQNVKTGRMAQPDYLMLQREWKWTPDTTQLSASPIKCYVYVIKGFDESRGKWAVMIDTNNDLDFSNETPVYPEVIPLNPVPDIPANTRMVQYETYREGQIRQAQTPLVVGLMQGDFVYGSPHHAVARVQQGNNTHEVLVISATGRPSFESAQLYLPSAVLASGKVDPQKLVQPGETIEIGGVLYINRGVDTYHNQLLLETTDAAAATAAPSLQIGHQFKPFAAREISTKQPVSLAGLRGKYVYIDFWGTWCKGCVAQLPALKTTYASVDKKQVAFLGIACNDSPARVREFARNQRVTWPQIMSDDTNRLVDRYQVRAFPTSVLLDPNGVIIARDLHGKALQDKLAELTQPK